MGDRRWTDKVGREEMEGGRGSVYVTDRQRREIKVEGIDGGEREREREREGKEMGWEGERGGKWKTSSAIMSM